MSVINDVLKELQGRESRFTPLDLAADGAVGAAPPRRSLLAPLGLLVLLVACGAWLYQWWAHAPPTPATLVQPGETGAALPSRTAAAEAPAPIADPGRGEAAPVEAVDEAPPATANAIIGLQLREAEDGLRMEFVLRQRAVAYLKQRSENGFAYHLGDVESHIVAPTISDSRWLRQLDIDSAGDGVDIRFVTATDVLVETRQARGDGEYRWAIELRQASAPELDAAPLPLGEPSAPKVVVLSPTEKPEPSAAEPALPPVESASAPRESEEVRVDIRATDPLSGGREQLEAALQLVESGRLAEAESRLRDLLGGSVDYDARRHLLALYVGRGQQDRVELLARDSTGRYDGDPLFVTEYARSLFQRAAYAEVIALLGGLDALDARQLSLMAVSYQRLERHALAIRYFQLALQRDAAVGRNWIGLAISQEQAASPGEALASYQRALVGGDLNGRLRAFAEARRFELQKVVD